MKEKTTSIEEARIGMHGRILRCPVGENPEDCPLYAVRQWPLEKRVAWLESKSDDDVLELYNYHTNCLEQKLAERPD